MAPGLTILVSNLHAVAGRAFEAGAGLALTALSPIITVAAAAVRTLVHVYSKLVRLFAAHGARVTNTECQQRHDEILTRHRVLRGCRLQIESFDQFAVHTQAAVLETNAGAPNKLLGA